MSDSLYIKKVAVLGAGVMGAQIAAHCVNAGIETLLFDLTAPTGPSNAIAEKAIKQLAQLKPQPLATQETANLIQARNYDEHIDQLSTCDLIIEAIAERMDWKEALYKRITPYLQEHTVLVTNTSGLSINGLAARLPEARRAFFCGMHFFNPPRYMHLAELIPATTTDKGLLDKLETWLTSQLGKGVVRAKDTPNFIANRIGVFSLLITLHHGLRLNLGLDTIDALTGSLLGRPKSATCRTLDVVGLDTMQHVIHTMQQQLGDDPWHAAFTLPSWLTALIQQGHLGQKSGQGLYRKNGAVIEVYDIASGEYRPTQDTVDSEVLALLGIPDNKQRMQQLYASSNKQAQFLAACYRDLFHYCAYHLADIAHSVRDVDLALRWGFGWAQGPFETWQLAGLKEMLHYIQAAIDKHTALSTACLPSWVLQLDAFYTEAGAYAPKDGVPVKGGTLPVYSKQFFPVRVLREQGLKLAVRYENEGVKLSEFKKDIAMLQFKTRANTIGLPVLEGMEEALAYAQQNYKGLIWYQDNATNFSSGADLADLALLLQDKKYQALEAMVAQFQRVAMSLKYSAIPIVAAVRGRAIGGGCELMMHCSRVVAAFESYPGLVELGMGLIPAGGGCKEMALRAAKAAALGELVPYVGHYFKQIAQAKVATSAKEGLYMGYLRQQDLWVMHADEVLYAALATLENLQASNYLPPLRKAFQVAGIEGYAQLQVGLVNWWEGGYLSQHDYWLCKALAKVLCGGEVNSGTLVNEDWILQLERETFMEVISTPLTQARIGHFLETGKVLRN